MYIPYMYIHSIYIYIDIYISYIVYIQYRYNIYYIQTFVDFDIRHRMVSLLKLCSVTLTYFVKVKFLISLKR